MNFRVLFDPEKRPDLPRCEAHRKTPYANDGIGTDYRCSFAAHYVVNGKDLCSKHAGTELLRMMKEEGYQLVKGDEK